MGRRRRTILGFLAAPLAPALALTLLAMLGGGPLGGLVLGFYALGLNALVGYPVALAAGLPLFCLFQRLGWTGLAVYVCGGLALGGLTGAAASQSMLAGGGSGGGPAIAQAAAFIAAGSFCGALAAACFWLIVRPDLVAEP